MKNENDAHQDCLCSLAKLIGHSEASFHNYEPVTSIWNAKPNTPIEEKDIQGGKAKEKKRKLNRSFEFVAKENTENNLID